MYNTKSDKPRFEILQLAEAAVTDREKQYSSPDVNYDRVARIVQVILQDKLRPKTTSSGYWYNIVPEDDKLLEDNEVKAWLDQAEEILWKHLYNPASNFINTTGEVDDDLVTFGTGCGFIGLRPDMSGLQFKAFHLNKVHLDVSRLCADG